MDDSKTESPRKRDSATGLIAALVVFIAVLIYEWLADGRTVPIIRELSYSTGGFEVKKIYEFPHIRGFTGEADRTGDFYATIQTSLSYFAFDTRTGEYVWKNNLCTGRDGGRTIIVSKPILYAATALGIYACQANTGEYVWYTRLGNGHVAVIPQLEPDASILRVYYGDLVYELDPSSGEIQDKYSKGDLHWKIGQVGIYSDERDFMEGRDLETGKVLWENRQNVFWVDEWAIPLQLDSNTLLVKVLGAAICRFDFVEGIYNWCSDQEYLSNISVDAQNLVGYAIRSDFVLVGIDLQTGAIQSETGFSPSELPENDNNVYWYFTAVTDKNTVLAFFGDSTQLFVLNR